MELQEQSLPSSWRDLPPLASDEVQVFTLQAAGKAGLPARARSLLSPAELERAGRIRVDGAREEFVVGRAALRVLLGSALGAAPKEVPIEADCFGKPFVPGVHSNVSHSRGLIYVALCRAASVGIDVEWIDPAIEALEMAQANFSPEEAARVESACEALERAHLFCTLWTRKEAVAKADGRGLTIPLSKILVPTDCEGPGWIEAASAGTTASGTTASGTADFGLADPGRAHFHVQALPAPDGFIASLAVQGKALPVRLVRLCSFIPSLRGVL